MDRITDQCEGVVGISDDLTVYGDTQEQHDKRLINLLKVAKKEHHVKLKQMSNQGKQHLLLRQAIYT